ncbi:MAG: NAD-dependent epimerase/dehydratase family protein [Thermoplasmataceae archaeon]
MKLIVFGGSGYLGSRICKGLGAEQVSYYSRTRNNELDAAGYKWIEGSITEKEKVIESIKDYDTIVDSAGIWNETAQKHSDVNITGVKNIVDGIKKYDTDQRLIYVSHINVDFAPQEHFRTRRITEGNVNLIKNSMVIRASNLFGDGARIYQDLARIAGSELKELPGSGNLAPVHVDDFVQVMAKSPQFRGSMNVCSRENITMGEAANLIRENSGRKPAVLVSKSAKSIQKSADKLKELNLLDPDRIEMLILNYYRENTSLYRHVPEPRNFRETLKQVKV